MDDIDNLPLDEKLVKLLRMIANGRADAAIKLAEVLHDYLQPAKKAK